MAHIGKKLRLCMICQFSFPFGSHQFPFMTSLGAAVPHDCLHDALATIVDDSGADFDGYRISLFMDQFPVVNHFPAIKQFPGAVSYFSTLGFGAQISVTE